MQTTQVPASEGKGAPGFAMRPVDDEKVAGLGGDREPASPEEQQQYDAFIDNALQLVYGSPKRRQATIAALSASDDPVRDLAATTASIVKRVEDSAATQKQKLGEGVTYQAGAEILEDLAELARVAGVHEFSEEELEKAGYSAIDFYRASRGDSIDQDKAGTELADLINTDPSLARVVQSIIDKSGGLPSAKKDQPSVNPETGLQEFADDASTGIDVGTMGAAAEAAASDHAAAIDAMGGKADANDVGMFGGLLERALSYVNNNPVAVLSVGMPFSGVATTVAGFAGRQNEKQAQDAIERGNFNQNGSLFGGGLAGEKVGISLTDAGPVDPDTGKAGPKEDAGSGDVYAPPPTEAATSTADNYRLPAPRSQMQREVLPARRRVPGFAQMGA